MLTIVTESGSAYEWDQDNKRVRRVQADTELSVLLRKDGEWLPVLWAKPPAIGVCWQLALQIVDDLGTATVRTTTKVVQILVDGWFSSS